MKHSLRYLSRADVEACALSMNEVVELVEAAFLAKGRGEVEMPPKPGIHPMPDSFIHAMPAYLPAMGAAGMKWVSGFPTNQARGLPYITGLLILNDPETGFPTAVMDCTWITAERTGAATAVAARYLARPDTRTAAILGCGVQGRANVAALKCVLPELRRVQAYDVAPDRLKSFVGDMADRHGLEVVPVASPRQALAGAEAVVTAGPILKHPTPSIEAGWLEEGAFACPVDFDCYWKPAALHAVDRFYTDDTSQTLYYRGEGYFQDIPAIFADLGEVVAGRKPGRQRPEERLLAMNLGVALEDMAVARRVYDIALARGIGTELPL